MEESPTERRWDRDPKVWAAILFALLAWASAFPGIRAGMRIGPDDLAMGIGYGPFQLAALRFITCSLFLAGYALITRMKMPAWRDVPTMAAAGLLGITTYHSILNYASQHVSSGAAAMVIASSPIFTVLLARMFLDERPSARKLFGILVAFMGVIIVALGESGGTGFEPAALLILISAFCYAAYGVIGKRPLQRYSPLQFTAVSIWAGTIPLLFLAPSLWDQMRLADPAATFAGIYIGIVPAALAYLAWNFALSRTPVTSLAVFLNGQPVLTAIIAWLWLGEIPTALSVLGGVVALFGIAIVQWRGTRPRAIPDAIARS